MTSSDILFILLPYLVAKTAIIYGETSEFDDFPAVTTLVISLLLTYLLLAYTFWKGRYSHALPLLAISAMQLLSIKDGSYNAFFQTSILIEIFILGTLFRAPQNLDLTNLGFGALFVSTGYTILQSR